MSRRSTFPEIRGAAMNRGERNLRRSQTLVAVDGNRKKVAGAFEWLGEKLGTPAPDAFDDSEFRSGPAADFPTVPAEAQRNPELRLFMDSYNPPRDSQGHATPSSILGRQRSAAGSFAESSRSGIYLDRVSIEDQENQSSVERALARKDTLEVPKPVFQSPIPWNTSPTSASGTVSLANVDGGSPMTKMSSNPGI
jgi:hypothetical protein